MIITISGTPGSGKSTIAKVLASRLEMKHFSAGDFMRKMAEERGVSLKELTDESVDNYEIDREIDERTKKLLEKEKDNFVIDARVAFYFIPDSVKIFLKVNAETAAGRIYNDLVNKKRIGEGEPKSKEEVLKSFMDRFEKEKIRYRKYYSINYTNIVNFDLIVDTSGISIEEVLGRIIEFVEKIA